MADIPAIPTVLIVAGGYLAWFGIHYWRKDVRWPSDPVKAVLTGNSIPAATPTPSTHALLTADVQSLQPDSGTSSTSSTTPTTGGTAPKVSGNYTTADLIKLWQSAGGSATSAKNAACHALQESSGNPGVTSHNPDGGTNVGLWQLDTKGVGAGYTVAQLQDPATNARLTVMHTSNGTNWSQWATPGC